MDSTPKRSTDGCWRRSARLCALVCLQFLLLVINTRAIAKGSVPLTLSTDAVILLANWSMFKNQQAADTWRERLGYTVGGLLGSYLGLWLTASLQ
jgi:hypothetical protein